MTLATGFTSCEDMLTGNMDRHVEIDEVAQDTLYSYWGILSSLQRIAERYVILGECRGDMVDGTEYISDSISSILEFGINGDAVDGSNRYLKAADFYHVVNECNAYILRADTAKVSGLNRSLMLSEYAQVATIRAWAYLQLVLTYNRVPYFEQPMLSTADMEAFRNAPQYVDINTLATSGVVRKVEEVCYVPSQLAGDSIRVIPYPDYFYYGRTSIIAYASQCVFPQDLVLGDIYLLRAQGEGSEADYRTAAQHYYNFLNSEKGGPLVPNTYYGLMRKDRQTEQYELAMTSRPTWIGIFNTVAKTSSTQEVVTVIPSNTNKLWGEVQRGVNELFGFRATISVNTSAEDTTTSASIYLTREFERQLVASEYYRQLNRSQNYESYIGPSGSEQCTVYDGAGDARYYMATSTFTDYAKGSNEEETFVMKQNPGGGFSTTFPVIYRKANVWLHFAQALNGAGYPGYAFAILRHGLVGSDGWVPDTKAVQRVKSNAADGFPLTVVINGDYVPETVAFYDPTTVVADQDTVFYTDYVQFYLACLAEGLDTLTTNKDSVNFFTDHRWAKALTYNQQAISGSAVCDYISRREAQSASSAPFLNFGTIFLRGSESNNKFSIYGGITDEQLSTIGTNNFTGGACSMGIHQRGCGILKLAESRPTDRDAGTTYNYVDQINKMRRLYAGATEDLTEEEIYDPANLREVQDAIASLILDEQGLETAFEGTRFFDLLCYSRLIGGTEGVQRVAKRIAERKGQLDGSLYGHLQNQNNWFFQLP